MKVKDNNIISQRTEKYPHFKNRLTPNDSSQDTSEDSGIVTDDSEAKSDHNSNKYIDMKINKDSLVNNTISNQSKATCPDMTIREGIIKPVTDDPKIKDWVDEL